MEPTIRRGSTIGLDTVYFTKNEPKRWDVVVFGSPTLEGLYENLGQKKIEASKTELIANAAVDISQEENVVVRPHIFYIKRIVGLPGESLRFTQRDILCNGKPVVVPRDIHRCYRHFEGYERYRYGADEFLVPDDNLFLLSDNLSGGKDSREIGTVPISLLMGLVIL